MTDNTDLIERLRNFDGSDALGNGDFSLMLEAADALEAARVDAERYRWLRDNEQDRADVFLAHSFEELDAAIDAARGARNG